MWIIFLADLRLNLVLLHIIVLGLASRRGFSRWLLRPLDNFLVRHRPALISVFGVALVGKWTCAAGLVGLEERGISFGDGVGGAVWVRDLMGKVLVKWGWLIRASEI